jgi:hypothetical protein
MAKGNKKWLVEVSWTEEDQVEVEANSEEEARELALDEMEGMGNNNNLEVTSCEPVIEDELDA